jgi:glycosyltransferase involved in cell wall biosynthesis
MRRLKFQHVINWVFNPAAAIIAGQLGEEQLIYYCVDEYTAFSGVASSALAEMETKLLKQSDLVIVSAERLYQSKAPHNPNTVLVQHGVDFEHFRKACTGEVEPIPEQASLPRPILGFFGLVADWVDVDLMAEMARRFPEGSLVIVGKVSTDVSKLESLPNVHFFGRKPYADLPAYCAGWDVSLMPFRINELTLNANPLKVREYLAAGLPVISTSVPEVESLGLCRIASNADEFEREIREALADPGPTIERSNQIRHESWEARLRDIERHLAEAAAGAAKGRP